MKGKHSFKVYEVIVGAKEPSSDSSNTSCRHSFFIPDILIAAFQPGTPVVNKHQFSEEGEPIEGAVEITSGGTSRETDMNAKLTQYARRGIKIYIIIDRDKEACASSDRRQTRKRDPKVLVCTLETSGKKKKNRVREYRGLQKISSPFFEETTGRGVLNPPETWGPCREDRASHLADLLARDKKAEAQDRRIEVQSKEIETHKREKDQLRNAHRAGNQWLRGESTANRKHVHEK